MASMRMTEREDPKLFKFDAEGAYLCGVLTNIDTVKMESGPCPRYNIEVIEDDRLTGECFVVMGTAALNNKIRRGDVGHVVEIRYCGEDHSVRKNGNSMKVFKVLVSDEPFQHGDTVIASSDVGF